MIRSSVWGVSCRNQASWLLQNSTRRVYSSAVPTIAPATRRKLLRPRNLFGATIVGLLVGYGIDREVNASVLQRNLRTAIAGIQIAIDYKINFDPKNAESIEKLHERCAGRLLSVCEWNGGLYVKLGQALGVQAGILPKAYGVLTKMLDDAEKMPASVVRAVVEKEFGKKIEEIFDSFDDTPIAAASIAQVHRAILKSSKEVVAVKVQRPSIESQAYWDLLSFRVLLRFYSHIFDLPFSYFGQYISDQILMETDFLHELKSATKAKKNIEEDPEKIIRETTYIPKYFDEMSSKKILIMEYINDAVRMTDDEKIKQMGLSIKEVARSVCEVSASQIFQHGLVNADAHPANILIRRHPNGKRGQHQVVLIDFGLCVELSETFRREYATLWSSIFQLDIKKLEEITTNWGMAKGSSELFASATLMRPWKKPKSKEEQEAEDEAKRLDNQHAINKQKEMIKGFLEHVELVPNELIFVSRSMRIIQASNQALHSPVNRINILARHAASALISTEETPTFYRALIPKKNTAGQQVELSHRLNIWFHSRTSYFTFRTTLLILDFAFVGSAFVKAFSKGWVVVKQSVLHGPWSQQAYIAWAAKTGGLEDDLEAGMRKMAKDEFGIELQDDAFIG